MKFLDLQSRITTNIFTFLDVVKQFSNENRHTIKIQLDRFAKRGLIKKIKRELYCFNEKTVDELYLANLLYRPSYISLETALNFYGIIPDIPQAVTSITPTTTKIIKNSFGVFTYAKIKSELFFGFTRKSLPQSELFFTIAVKEKSLLDYFYLRKIKTIKDLRLNLEGFDKKLYHKYVKSYPSWVQKIEI